MALAFRASTTAAATGTTDLTLAKPSGLSTGDLMVAFVQRSVGDTAVPAGWTAVVFEGITAGDEVRVYTKTAGASEPASYAWPCTNGGVGTILAYSGNAFVDVFATWDSGGTSGNSITAPSVTTTDANGVVLAYFGTGLGNTSLSTPSGTTSRAFQSDSSHARSIRVVDFWQLSAGATGDKTSTAGGNHTNRFGVQVALLPSNTAPNAPTGLSPDGATIDRGTTRRFSWTFSDPDAGDTQSKYDLRYRLTSATTWTTVSGTTPNTFHDFTGGTFAAGDYEWQVRTYDALGVVGPYSGSAFFTAADSPAGPTITDPVAGQTISEESYTVVWSTPSQESFQVRTVADSAGSPDTTTVYTDTGEVVSSSARSRPVAFAVNGRAEHVQVRVKDAGLWSAWSSVNVTVSYTVPATPTVAVDETTLSGAILVQATHPAPGAGEPTVTSVDVYRRVTADGGDGIRVAAALAPTALYTDWAVASGLEYGYRVQAHADNGTSAWSAWSETPTTINAFYGGGYDV